MDLVYGALFNDDYEGTVSQMGDTVRINAIGQVNVFAYQKDTDLTPPQSLNDAETSLTISQASAFNFAIDDVDQAQTQPKIMGAAMREAAYALALTMDKYYSGFYTDASATNLIGTAASPVTPSLPTQSNIGGGATVYDYLVVLNQYLTQNATPLAGRWCVVPPWITTALTQDPRFTSYNTADARTTIMSGKLDASAGQASDAYLGKIEGMDVYQSLNAPHLSGTIGQTGSTDVVLAGHTMALSKAEGMNKLEAYRPPTRFSDAVKGLALYGAKTVRPSSLAAAYLVHP